MYSIYIKIFQVIVCFILKDTNFKDDIRNLATITYFESGFTYPGKNQVFRQYSRSF